MPFGKSRNYLIAGLWMPIPISPDAFSEGNITHPPHPAKIIPVTQMA